MARIKRFEDIEAWKVARELTRKIYSATLEERFAKDFALNDQIRRAAISIMSNIAEGFERGGDREFIQHLAMAKASCGEVRCQLYIALDQSYLSPAEFDRLTKQAESISRMLANFMAYLQKSPFRGSKFKPVE